MSVGPVLVLNPGSSSLKASLVAPGGATLGRVEMRWGSDASRVPDRSRGVADAVAKLVGDRDGGGPGPVAVGYRVVHGGPRLTASTSVDDEVLREIEAAAALAPLHDLVALDTIAAGRELLPGAAHVVCFDTAFHASLPPEAYRYPVPERWYADWGVRRFGFHGLSVAWSVRRAAELLGRPAEGLRLVVAHLGSGCSVTAVDGARSVDTSMGLTPLEGLMMGTRSGSVDPGALLHLLREGRLTAGELEEALIHRSGLAAVSGLGGDVEAIQEAADRGDEAASLALAMFERRAAAAIAAAATALPGWDGLVFTGGIGERAIGVRNRIVARLATLGVGGVSGEPASERAEDAVLTGGGVSVPILRIEAREDLVVAAEVAEVLSG